MGEGVRHGRRQPYTATGVKRLPCVRGCGRKAHASWQACADGGIYRPLCLECDIEINEMVLRWMRDPEWESKMAAYRGAGA